MTLLQDAAESGYRHCLEQYGLDADASFEKEAGMIGRLASRIGGAAQTGIANMRSWGAGSSEAAADLLKQNFGRQAKASQRTLSNANLGATKALSPADLKFHQDRVTQMKARRGGIQVAGLEGKAGAQNPNAVSQQAANMANPAGDAGAAQVIANMHPEAGATAAAANTTAPGGVGNWLKSRPAWQKYTAAGAGGAAMGYGLPRLMGGGQPEQVTYGNF
jgi:hypothetical protein